MTAILSLVIPAIAGLGQRTTTPIAIRATGGAWIGLRNDANNPLEICDLSVSIQTSRHRGTLGRVSGGFVRTCDIFSNHFLVLTHETHLRWMPFPDRWGERVTFSLHATAYDALGNRLPDIRLVWKAWSDVTLNAVDLRRWKVAIIKHRDAEWVRATNQSRSAQAVSFDPTGENGCSSALEFHLVLPNESVVEGNPRGKPRWTMFQADASTCKCVRAETLRVPSEGE